MFKCFKKKVRSHGNDGNVNPTDRKWSIIIPHTKKAQGARTKDNYTEYKYGIVLADEMQYPYETRDEGGVKGAASRLVKRGFNCSLEPHKNAFNGKAHGFEILCLHDDELSIDVAEILAQAFKEKYPDRRLRHGNGVKKIRKGDRGYYNLRDAKRAGMMIALLSESFFIDNPNEWIAPDEMAKFWLENLK